MSKGKEILKWLHQSGAVTGHGTELVQRIDADLLAARVEALEEACRAAWMRASTVLSKSAHHELDSLAVALRDLIAATKARAEGGK